MRQCLLAVIVPALFLAPVASAAQRLAADLALSGATIVDVSAGALVKGKTVLLKGDTIIAVVDDKGLKRYAPNKTLRLPGKYLMPGLWDSHVHFGSGDAAGVTPQMIEENKRLLPLYLAHGITAVRDCAGDMADVVLDMRAQVAAGTLEGPTIFTSGAKLEGIKPLWKGVIEVGTPAEVSAALDKLQGQKVDFVKITENTMTPAIYLEALKQAKARGLRTSGHVPVQLTLDQVAEQGLGTIEHQGYLLRATTPREKELTAQVADGKLTGREASTLSLEGYDEASARAAFRRLAAAGTAVVPTLNGSFITSYLDQNDHRNDNYLQFIGKGLRASYAWRVQRAAKDSPAAIALRHATIEKAASLLPILAQEGVSILAGTDAGFLNSYNYPGAALNDELAIFVRYGLTPAQALRSAVVEGPRFLGKLDRYGSVEKNKLADLIVLDADPLQDITATRKLHLVVSRGKVYDRARLDKLLSDTRAWVAAQP
jgi:imidazolonepropionase-like amidohydrolase